MDAYAEVKRLAEQWGLKVDARTEAERTADGMGATLRCIVEVERPTELRIDAALREERLSDKLKRAVGRGDPVTGDEVFDKRVWVDAGDEQDDETMALLEDQKVRAALLEALRVARHVSLAATTVSLQAIKTGMLSSFSAGEINTVERAALVLAVAVERWARER